MKSVSDHADSAHDVLLVTRESLADQIGFYISNGSVESDNLCQSMQYMSELWDTAYNYFRRKYTSTFTKVDVANYWLQQG